ncbi:competence type IV pilus minor pilin ComGF [Oceanobacillus senegalensis]|uniref:competence type IV pilus minor pilin ComGF n=1 Tax=Oceanobacillus senegalensis TaxID=1936063 RepID=UPI000A310E09|nr:competence type IV pilus minor pilin ComGF [Oceanobacillus senegalensis]
MKMGDILTRPFAFMAYLKDEKAFSFVSLLFAISIIVLTLPLVGYLFQATNHLSANDNELSIQQFFQFMRDEMINSEENHVLKDKLVLYQSDSKVTFEQYGNTVRRQVNGTGHEILLRGVKKIEFEANSIGVRLHITSSKGETYEKNIVYYH